MNAALLLDHYARIADTPDAIARLRRFVLDLAVRGKLVEQDEIGSFTDDPDAPFAIPSNWRWRRIGDELELLNGMAFKPTDWVPSGLPIVRIQNLNNSLAPFNFCDPSKARDRSLIDDGTFLISWSGTPGTSFGAFIWQRGKAVLNQHIFRCDFKTENFDAAFLRLAINGRLDEMIAKAHGGVGLQHITKGKLEAMLIVLPPLAVQHRIVAKVNELMALCNQLEAARAEREAARDTFTLSTLAKLNTPDPETFDENARFALANLAPLTTHTNQIKQLRQTILNLAVRGKLVEQDAADEPGAVLWKRLTDEKARLVKAGSIPHPKEAKRNLDFLTEPLPPSWLPIALGDVCNLVTSGSRGWGEFYAESGPGFVRAQNIRFGKLRLDGLACVNPPAKSEGARTQVAKGDLLVVITGAGVTNPALLDVDLGEAYVSQHVGLVRPCDPELSRWLLLCLMADAGGRAELTMRAYGAGKPGLNLDNIRSLSVPLPPLAEQHRIVAKVDALMALCDQLEASLTMGEQTRSRLMEAVLHNALEPA